MGVNLKPKTESQLKQLAITTGREPEDLLEEAMAGYLAELNQTRKMLDSRYDDIRSGRVQPLDGDEAFKRIRDKSEQRRGS